MSYNEAVEDGVRHVNEPGNGWYYPPCSICGAEVPSWGYQRGKQYRCKQCKFVESLADKEDRKNERADVKEKKFQNATQRIAKVAKLKDIPLYESAAEIIHKKLHKDKWFDSTEEIMVAIELVKNKVKAMHQVKLGKYRADFVLPDLKIVLEVDGVCYHTERTRQKEELRDSLIVAALGPEWEVIRITDELINQNITRLVKAIIKARDGRQKVRSQHNGQLPRWYTDRKMA